MKYCSRCVLPDTRPGLIFNSNGLCSACVGHDEKRSQIDWKSRREEFESLVKKVKKSHDYHCVIPVSGGKDSTWQVIKCLEYGLKILAVTWRSPGRNDLGQQNLDNLIRLGVDHIDFSINPEVERKFMYKTLCKTGSVAVPMHLALFAIPLRIAVKFDIPLIVWGESLYMEYGGTAEDRKSEALDYKWLKRQHILKGTFAEDWIDKDLSQSELLPYCLPSEEEFNRKKIQSIFLGFYFNWDPEEVFRIISQQGFQPRNEGPKVGYYNYADIDCDFISVHHHFKWLKFGFTRLFDNLAIEIRNGRMTRNGAIEKIKFLGYQAPREDINAVCNFLRISESHFHEIEEKFRNTEIWVKNNGKWQIKDFVIRDWEW